MAFNIKNCKRQRIEYTSNKLVLLLQSETIMEIFSGFIIGLIYSTLAATRMVLVTRYAFKNLHSGITACIGAIIPQLLLAIIAILGISAMHLHFLLEASKTSQDYLVIFSSALLFYTVHKFYKFQMPNEEKKNQNKNLINPFSTLLIISLATNRNQSLYSCSRIIC